MFIAFKQTQTWYDTNYFFIISFVVVYLFYYSLYFFILEKSERLRLKSKREIVKLKDQLDTHGGRVTSNHHSRRKSKEQGSVERERFAERAAAASRRASVLSLQKTKQKENTQEQRGMCKNVENVSLWRM